MRYLVVGGFAVAAHGHRRATVDLDRVIGLGPRNILRGLHALVDSGFRPKLSVTVDEFADPATRRRWIDEKNRVVFQLWHRSSHGVSIHVFVKEPFDFELEYGRALEDELMPGLKVP